MATTKKMNILRGKTYLLPIRFEVEPVISKPITAISTASGFPRLTVPGHGAPNGWSGYVIGVDSPRQINAGFPVRDCDFRKMTVIDANTIEFNGWVPVDDNNRLWAAYTSGGFLQFNTPQDLTDAVVRAKVKDKNGNVLLSTELADAPHNLMTATVDEANFVILIEIPSSVAAALPFEKAQWEAEIELASGRVYPLVLISDVSVSDEIVT